MLAVCRILCMDRFVWGVEYSESNVCIHQSFFFYPSTTTGIVESSFINCFLPTQHNYSLFVQLTPAPLHHCRT